MLGSVPNARSTFIMPAWSINWCTVCVLSASLKNKCCFWIHSTFDVCCLSPAYHLHGVATLLGLERISNEQVRCQMNVFCLLDDGPATTQPEMWLATDFYSRKCWEGPLWGELEELSGMMMFFIKQWPVWTTITSTGQAWGSIFYKNFLRRHKTGKNGPHFCKLSGVLGAAHGMLPTREIGSGRTV